MAMDIVMRILTTVTRAMVIAIWVMILICNDEDYKIRDEGGADEDSPSPTPPPHPPLPLQTRQWPPHGISRTLPLHDALPELDAILFLCLLRICMRVWWFCALEIEMVVMGAAIAVG
jgi:hypothetical protein